MLGYLHSDRSSSLWISERSLVNEWMCWFLWKLLVIFYERKSEDAVKVQTMGGYRFVYKIFADSRTYFFELYFYYRRGEQRNSGPLEAWVEENRESARWRIQECYKLSFRSKRTTAAWQHWFIQSTWKCKTIIFSKLCKTYENIWIIRTLVREIHSNFY